MGEHSSGYYSIDGDYYIIGFNDTAKKLYPSLQKGVKCYKALMGLDEPCPPCPVANGICGPRTYLDPIRHIYETVDAVETILPDGSRGHALVFSTVDEGERLASTIPTGEGSLRLLGALNLLSSKYTTVFGVDLDSTLISVFRSKKLFENPEHNMKYNEAIEGYIMSYVHPEDQRQVRELLDLQYIQEKLSHVPSFKVHFRVMLEEIHYYYFLIARNGDTDDYKEIVMAVACEDEDVNTRRIYERQLDSLVSSLDHAAGFFHLDITDDRILRIGGTSSIVSMLNKNSSIDELMERISAYILLEKDRLDFLKAYSLKAIKEEYQAGKVEILRESRCYYDDNIARWSRYTLRLFVNPVNNHLEGMFYGTDITQDRDSYEAQVSIVQTLTSNYLDVLWLNTVERTATLIKHGGFLSTVFEERDEKVYPYDKLLKQYIADNVHPDEQQEMLLATDLDYVMEQLKDQKEYSGNYRIVYQGKEHYYQFRFIKNEEYGSVVLGFLNVDDIVSAKIEQQQQLERALAEAERANAAKSQFLARMSHDMRTPLNGILGILEIDKKHADDVDYLKENRKRATVVTNHIIALINDVLDMSKIEDGSLVLAHEPFNILEEEKDAAVIVNVQANEAGISNELVIVPREERLNYVYGSPLHLRRAMMNIYSNCVKYNQKNGKITTEVRPLFYDEKTVTYQWTIKDTGIGMSEEFLENMFDPFVQERMDARSVYQGTGLGMSITKAIIEQMGGTIEVSSHQGQGSTFVVTIPFELADKIEVGQTEGADAASIRGMHILLVEDNKLNREIAEVILAEEGAEVTAVFNGKEAVETVIGHPEGTFDIVLMDIMMPEMDGYEATRCIRNMKRSDAATLPIVAMTANAFSDDVQKCFEVGMNAHLAKPLEIDRMIKTIAKFSRR